MFIEQGISPVNKFWKYIVGSLILIIASTIGQLPLLFAVVLKNKSINIDEKVLMTTLSRNMTLFLLLLSFAFGLFALYLVVKHLHKQTFLSVTTSRKKVDWSRIFFSFGIWSIFTIGSTVLMYYSNPTDFKLNFDASKFIVLCIIAVIFIPIQTSTEEYVFRGYLMQGFGIGSLHKKFIIGLLYTLVFVISYFIIYSIIKAQFASKVFSLVHGLIFLMSFFILFLIDFILTKINFFDTDFYCKLSQMCKNKFVPLFMTSVIFGTMHIANPEVEKMGYIILVYYIGTGFFLGIMTLMDEGMELALGFHAANNLIGALLITSDWTAFQTDSILIDKSDPSAGLEILVPIFIIFPLILFIFSKRYKWTNWKEKLTGDIFQNDTNIIENIGYDSNTNSDNV